MLGLAGGLRELLASPPRVLIVYAEDLAGDGDDAVRAALGRVDTLLVIGSQRTRTVESARAALPIPTYAETSGTFINFEGRLQKFDRALEPLGESRALPDLLAELAHALGKQIGWAPGAITNDALWALIDAETGGVTA